MAHDHGSHGHSHDAGHVHGSTDKKRVLIATCLTGGFMVAEALGGLLNGSLALLADAGHMLADAIALGFADHFVPHERLRDFAEAVVNDGHEDALNSYAEEPPPSALLAQRDWIDACYAGATVTDWRTIWHRS